jgi:UPF0755 protein
MSRRALRGALVVFAVTLVAAAIAGLLLYRYAVRYPDRPAGPPGPALAVMIPQGATFPQVTAILQKHGLVHSGAAFRVYVNYKGVAAKIRAGSYTLQPDITPRKLLDVLVHGVPAPLCTVLIPEGKTMLDVADILAGAKIAPRKELLKEMRNKRLLARLGVSGDSIEGYLFPETYKLRAGMPAAEALEKLVQQHRAVWATLTRNNGPALRFLRKKLAWGHPEIVTLASIVEKETGQKKERPLIAGVFLNRLTFPSFSPKVLQTDPTIIYGCTVPLQRSPACKTFDGRIRRVHLDDKENVYNTYTHVGLPPGPIANPGRAALQAVLAPEKSKYLYFVSRNDGTHYFSSTKTEHEQAVDKYQRHRSSTP